MTVPSGKLICPPTGFVILHFEVQCVYTVYRSLSRIMFLFRLMFGEHPCFTDILVSSDSPLSFIFLFLLCPADFHLLYCLFYFLSPIVWLSGKLHKMTNKGWRVIKPQRNQSILLIYSNMLTSETFNFHVLPIIRHVGCLQLSTFSTGQVLQFYSCMLDSQ